MKPLSEVAPGLLVIQIPIQAVWSPKWFKIKVSKGFMRDVIQADSLSFILASCSSKELTLWEPSV